MQIHHLLYSHSRRKLQDSQYSGSLKKFDVFDHASTNGVGKLGKASLNGSLDSTALGLHGYAPNSNGIMHLSLPLPHAFLVEMLFAFGTETSAFSRYPDEGRAIVSHWLRNPELAPISLDRSVAAKWHQFLRVLSGKATPSVSPKNSISYSGVPFGPPTHPKFRFADLFAGVGGFRIALQNLGGKCVFASEIDKDAKETYFRNFGEVPFGDIRQFTRRLRNGESIDKLIPDHEILVAGFPCQPFSPAGVSSRRSNGQKIGADCPSQGQLVSDILRIVRAKRPKVIFLENVTNFKIIHGGRSFSRLRKSIEALGYSFDFDVLDSSSLVPQRRKRLYIVCFKNCKKRFKFPTLREGNLPLSSILESSVESGYTISDKLWRGHVKRTKRNLARGVNFTAFKAALDQPAKTLVARYGKDGKECLIPQRGRNPRMLTPRECSRLQGFPDKFLLPAYDSRAYRQFGNAVVVPVIQKIGRVILRRLNSHC